MWTVESVAAELLACEAERREREPFTDVWPELDLDTGYEIQDRNLQARLHRGELRLLGSGDDWTEFECRLPAVPARSPSETARV